MKSLSDPAWVSGQIELNALEALAAADFTLLVNHRPDHEKPGQPTAAEIAEAAARHGLRMVWAPVRGLPDADAVQATADALQSLEAGRKALLFCRSGMRSAAAWAMARRLDGADPEDLRAAAASAGYDLSRLPL
jgi:sulfide:quinone oxidoreductase